MDHPTGDWLTGHALMLVSRVKPASPGVCEGAGRLAALVCGRPNVSSTGAVSAANVEIVRRIYAADNRRDAATALELLDPQIEVEYRGQLIDKDATYRGHAGVRELMQTIRENFVDFAVEVEEYIDQDEHVVVALHQRATGRASGVPVDIHIGQVWTLRGGKAVRWRIYKSKAEALAAVSESR